MSATKQAVRNAFNNAQFMLDNSNPYDKKDYEIRAEEFGSRVYEAKERSMIESMSPQDFYDVLEVLTDDELKQIIAMVQPTEQVKRGIREVSETEADKAEKAFLESGTNPAKLMAALASYSEYKK